MLEVCVLRLRVLCCSFHKYGHFFPGTGALDDIGMEEGLGYSVNVPLHEGINDKTYSSLFIRVSAVSGYRRSFLLLRCPSKLFPAFIALRISSLRLRLYQL